MYFFPKFKCERRDYTGEKCKLFFDQDLMDYGYFKFVFTNEMLLNAYLFRCSRYGATCFLWLRKVNILKRSTEKMREYKCEIAPSSVTELTMEVRQVGIVLTTQ